MTKNWRKHRDYHETHSVWPEETNECSECEEEYRAEAAAKHKADIETAVEAERKRIKRRLRRTRS